MPRIKRWSPISHDFNRDPEIIEMRQRFGDWTALAWQEMLHEADRNDGIVRGTIEQIAIRLAPISLQKYLGRAALVMQKCLGYIEKKGWIIVERRADDPQIDPKRGADAAQTRRRYGANAAQTNDERCFVRIVNHGNYHRSWEHKRAPLTSPPNPNPNPNPIHISSARPVEGQVRYREPAKPEPTVDRPKTEHKKSELDPAVKSVADKIYQLDRKRYSQLIVWITAASRHKRPAIVAAALQRFLPFASEPNIDWWPYLDKILDKTEVQINARNSESEAESHKNQERQASAAVFGGTRLGQKTS